MATEERLTVAPIVGPDDPRRFTDSGIEVQRRYAAEDLPAELELGGQVLGRVAALHLDARVGEAPRIVRADDRGDGQAFLCGHGEKLIRARLAPRAALSPFSYVLLSDAWASAG